MSLELISFNWSECCYREINLVAGIEWIGRETWRQGDVRRLCTVLFLSPFQNHKVCEIGNTSCNSSRVLCTQQLRKYLCILSYWYLFIHSSLDFYDYTFQDFFLPPYILHQFSCLCWLFLHCLTSEYWSTHGFILGLFLFPLITFPLGNSSVLWFKTPFSWRWFPNSYLYLYLWLIWPPMQAIDTYPIAYWNFPLDI